MVMFIIAFVAKELDLLARFGYDYNATGPDDPEIDSSSWARTTYRKDELRIDD